MKRILIKWKIYFWLIWLPIHSDCVAESFICLMMSSIDASYNGQIINIFFITKRIKSFILHSVTFFLINAVTFFIIINYSCNSSEAVWHSSIFALKLLSSICFFFPYLWKFSGYTKYTKDTKNTIRCSMYNDESKHCSRCSFLFVFLLPSMY